MGSSVLGIANGFAVFRSQFRIAKCNCLVDGRMTVNVRRIVRQSTQAESVLIGVLALVKQFKNKVAGPNIMNQVTELPAPERIIAEILDDGPTVSVCVCFLYLIFR